MHLFKKFIFSIFTGKYRTLLPSLSEKTEQTIWPCDGMKMLWKGAPVEKDGGRRNRSVWLRGSTVAIFRFPYP
jgi:hypothetical protein